MLITLYTPIGIEYQKFNINETDIIYGDLLKYINLPKNEMYDELDESNESNEIFSKVFIKTIINLFSYNQINIKEIKLDDEINGDIDKFTILFSYEYYIYNYWEKSYKKIENNIKNCDNISDFIKNDPYQIIFIDCDNENYEELCKLAVQQNGSSLEYVKEQTDEICKLAVQQSGSSLKYVKPELMNEEICKLAVRQNGNALHYVKPELMNDEICKLAVKKMVWDLNI